VDMAALKDVIARVMGKTSAAVSTARPDLVR
jgi:hypothetical protein